MQQFAIMRWTTPRLNFANMKRKAGRWYCAAIVNSSDAAIIHAGDFFPWADCRIIPADGVKFEDHMRPDDTRIDNAVAVPAGRLDPILITEAQMLRQRINAGKLPLVQHRFALGHLKAIEAKAYDMRSLEAAE
jgi:hypothetical protein